MTLKSRLFLLCPMADDNVFARLGGGIQVVEQLLSP